MPLLNRVRRILKETDWPKLLKRIQIYSAYLPIVLVPFIFSPFSVDTLYVEKIVTILFFSSISLISLVISNLIDFYKLNNSKNNKKSKKANKLEYKVSFYYDRPIKFIFYISLFVLISTLFSINQNQSLWGSGLILVCSLILWLFSIYQVWDKNKVLNWLITGISALALLDLVLLITRFNGSGSFSFLQPFKFTPNGDFNSLIFILFIGIFLSLRSQFKGKTKYLSIISLFLTTTAFIVFSYISSMFILAYIALFLLLTFYFLEKTNLKNKIPFLYKKENKASDKITISSDTNLKIITLFAAVIIGIFELFFQNSYLSFYRDVLPVNIEWNIMFKALTDNLKNLIIGIGPNNYLYTFLHFKPTDINYTQFWGNEYVLAPNSIFEIISTFGILPLSIIVFILFKKRKGLSKYKTALKNGGYFKIIFLIFFIVFFFLTSFNLVNIWVLFIFVIAFISRPSERNIDLNVEERTNIKNYAYRLNHYSLILLIPVLVLTILFYTSSVNVFFGSKNHNLSMISSGLGQFTFYPKSYGKIIDSLQTAQENDLLSDYVADSQNYARKALEMNTNDPYSNNLIINSLTTKLSDYSSIKLSMDFYNKLLSLAPNHIPYYIALSDLHTRVNNYQESYDTLKEALKLNPQLDAVLLRASNVAYFLQKFDDSKSFAEDVLKYTQNEDYKNAANGILNRLNAFSSDTPIQ